MGSSGHRTFRFTHTPWELRTTAITTGLGIACFGVFAIDALLLSGGLPVH